MVSSILLLNYDMLSRRREFLGKIAGVFGLTNTAGWGNGVYATGCDLLKPPPETMFPSEEYLRVSKSLRETVDEIREIRGDADRGRSSIYLGNVNNFEFSVIKNEIFETSVAEETVGKELEEMSDSDFRKLLDTASTDRLNDETEYGYMSKSHMMDSVEPGLLIDEEASIDVIELGDTEVESGKVGERLEDSLSPVLGSGYDLDTGTRSVELSEYGSADEAFRMVQKEYSKGSSEILQIYLTDEDLGEFGLMGYAPIDGNTVVVATEKGDMFQYDSQDVSETVVHETGHSLFDIQHTADDQDIMYYNDSVDIVDFGRRSQLLIQRYLNSSLETDVAETDRSSYLSVGFELGEIDSQVAAREFKNHLEMFLYDGMGFKDVENWNLNYRGRTSMGYDEVQATRDFEGEERIEMNIEINDFIEAISVQASI